MKGFLHYAIIWKDAKNSTKIGLNNRKSAALKFFLYSYFANEFIFAHFSQLAIPNNNCEGGMLPAGG